MALYCRKSPFWHKKLPFVWILSTRFCENCENVIWNKSCRNTVMVKAQKQWLGNSRRMMSRKQIEWSRLMIFLLSSVRTKSRSTQRERERDCSQRTQELIFLMCKVDYTICSAFNGFNTTVLLSNWWQKLNPLYFLKKNVDLVLPASTAGSRGKYIPPSLCKLHFKVIYWSIDWLSRIIHTDYFQGLNRFKTQREKNITFHMVQSLFF